MTRIGIGCEQLGGTDWGDVDVDAAMDGVRFAWENGVTVFDTADVYGLGASESRLADALGAGRHDATIVTKFGVRWEETAGRARTWKDSSPTYAVRALESSLRRLRVERIPVYLVHWPDAATSTSDLMSELARQRQLGKIGEYGVSNYGPEDLETAISHGATVLESGLSLANHQHRPSLDLAGRLGARRLGYGVYEHGLLTGGYTSSSTFAANDRRHRLPGFSTAALAALAPMVDELVGEATALGVRPHELALAWALASGLVDTALVGVRSRRHVSSALAAAQVAVDADLLGRLDSLSARMVSVMRQAG